MNRRNLWITVNRHDPEFAAAIFLTPHIVNSTSSMQRLTSHELENAELVDKAFTPSELEKYLDSPSLFPPALPPPTTARPAVVRRTVTKPPTAPASNEVRKAIAVDKKPAPAANAERE